MNAPAPTLRSLLRSRAPVCALACALLPGLALAQSVPFGCADLAAWSAPTTGFTANTAVFNGTADYLLRIGSATGLADSKAVSCSLWIKFNGGNGVTQEIFVISDGSTPKFRIRRNSSNKLDLYGESPGGTPKIGITTTTATLTADSTWHHVYIAIDQTNSGNCKIYIDGASQTLTTSVTGDIAVNLAPSSPRYSIAADRDGNGKLNAALAEFWFKNSYLDAPANFASAGHPLSLGSDGSTPTGGTKPGFYFSLAGSGGSWGTDSANANNLTANGSPGSTSSP